MHFPSKKAEKGILKNQNPVSKSPEAPWQEHTEGAGRRAPGWRGGRGGYTSSRKGLGLGCYPACREHECVIRSFFRMITLRKEPIGQETKQP